MKKITQHQQKQRRTQHGELKKANCDDDLSRSACSLLLCRQWDGRANCSFIVKSSQRTYQRLNRKAPLYSLSKECGLSFFGIVTEGSIESSAKLKALVFQSTSETKERRIINITAWNISLEEYT